MKSYLDAADVEYKINPKIVRGLDYYTKTVFEFVSNGIGSQGTICGGGRYDGLADEIGNVHLPALGFAMGLERILIVMEQQGTPFPEVKPLDLYIAPMGDDAAAYAVNLCNTVRKEGFSAITDYNSRGLKAQMKYANKIGAKFTLVLGDNELQSKSAQLKNMQTGESAPIALPDGLITAIYDESIKNAFNDLSESVSDEDIKDILKQ